MRSVSAFVKPATVATRITAKIASASGARCCRRANASQATGAPRIRKKAVGEPNSQNQYGRRLMGPGVGGPGDERDDAYVEGWTLLGDVRLLTRRGTVHHSVSNSSS